MSASTKSSGKSSRLLAAHDLGTLGTAPNCDSEFCLSKAYSSTFMNNLKGVPKSLLEDETLVPKGLLEYTNGFGFGERALRGSTLGEKQDGSNSAEGVEYALTKEEYESIFSEAFKGLEPVNMGASGERPERTLYPSLLKKKRKREAEENSMSSRNARNIREYSCFSDGEDFFDDDVANEYLFVPVANNKMGTFVSEVLYDFMGETFDAAIVDNPFSQKIRSRTTDNHGYQDITLSKTRLMNAMKFIKCNIAYDTNGDLLIKEEKSPSRFCITFQTLKEAERAKEKFLNLERLNVERLDDSESSSKIELQLLLTEAMDDMGQPWTTLSIPKKIELRYDNYFEIMGKRPKFDETMSFIDVKSKVKTPNANGRAVDRRFPRSAITSFTRFIGHFDHSVAEELRKKNGVFPCIETCAKRYFGETSKEARLARIIAIKMREEATLQRQRYILAKNAD